MAIYAVTIFLSAFLLFEVQPMIGKMILPWFGGSAAVWSTCLVFFQVALLLGYAYSHWLARLRRPKHQALVHCVLLAASFATLPVIPSPAWRSIGDSDPTLRILMLLASTIGLPYLLLSATGPLLQAWYVALRPGSIPYRLYALSNLGSMLALLSYPVAIEPALAAHTQAFSWSTAYAIFAAACAFTAVRFASRGTSTGATETEAAGDAPSPQDFLLWIALAACPAGLLLAVSTQLTHNVAPIPFLWVLPLAIYLLSFILCFESDRFYQRRLFLPLLAASLSGMAFTAYYDLGNPELKLALPVLCAGLFVCAMACHGELARRKPDPRYLTVFYLAVSLGGAIGGLFVAILAPRLFRDYYEFPGLLAYCAIVATIAAWSRLRLKRKRALWTARIAMLLMAAAVTGYVIFQQAKQSRRFLETRRNFYGVLHVRDRPDTDKQTGMRYLLNGTISHGSQITEAKYHRVPTSYYGENSGAGRAIRYFKKRGPVRVGVIGLGAGVLAAYCRAGDTFRFYEINPLDLDFAKTQFTFLGDCPNAPEVLLGDARLTLEREAPQRFDVLAVDAFSSDSIPAHLLTTEAFFLYFRHLTPDGVLAVHVSNRYLDLAPVVTANAAALGKQAVLVDDDGDQADYYTSSDWVLVTANPAMFQDDAFRGSIELLKEKPGLKKWTDDYSNLYQILK